MTGSLTAESSTTAHRAVTVEDRVVDAFIECIARWGIAKTTADDIARGAGVSRATLYRAFPGGKDLMLEALLRREAARFFATVGARLDAADVLEDRLVVGFVAAARFLEEHDALRYVIAHEPERVLPAFAFDRLGRTLAMAAGFVVPYLRPFVPDDATAARRAEWLVRILLSYTASPSPTVVLTDEGAVRRFVRAYLLPAFAVAEPI